jgi:hypothetical protein
MAITETQLRAKFLSPAMEHYLRKKLHHLPPEELTVRVDEALKFLVISPDCTGPIPVTKEIDEIWHYWILETREYAQLCQAIHRGEFIHHTSNDYLAYGDEGEIPEEDLLLGVRMLAAYVENFGPFEPGRTQYWLLAAWLCGKHGWSVDQLNHWLTSQH